MFDGNMFEMLVVDDSPVDIQIMKAALEGSRSANLLYAALGGEEALAFLRREGAFKDAQRPDLILLDLNMPKMGGLEVLAALKSDPDLRTIPTLILTSSDAESDVARAYQHQASGYIVKPVDLDDFTTVMGSIENFWGGIVKVPTKASN
jgi:CheY-like chemotaxis protein